MRGSDITEAELKKRLTPKQYQVLREKATEPPFSGEFVNSSEDGVYSCAACGTALFSSESKYESTMPGLLGWPSFAEVIDGGRIELKNDDSLGSHRIEVVCKTCGSHLGHLFEQDPDSPTGKHYCINSIALNFDKTKKEAA
jgi:peptide-methionine (R)-S-oxide reductase